MSSWSLALSWTRVRGGADRRSRQTPLATASLPGPRRGSAPFPLSSPRSEHQYRNPLTSPSPPSTGPAGAPHSLNRSARGRSRLGGRTGILRPGMSGIPPCKIPVYPPKREAPRARRGPQAATGEAVDAVGCGRGSWPRGIQGLATHASSAHNASSAHTRGSTRAGVRERGSLVDGHCRAGHELAELVG